MNLKLGVIALVCVALHGRAAGAYPTSIVFAPTGDAKGGGDVGVFVYSSMSFKPTVAPGASWFGFDVGVIPKIPYGRSGVSFGGLEIGVNGIVSDLLGTPQAFVKPVFDAKLQLITETKWSPHVAVGVMELDPFKLSRSMNMIYGAITKTIENTKTSYGRVTLGFSGVAHPFDRTLFYATGPFKEGAQLAFLAGYESPAFGPLSFAVDYVGGVSEVSSTNLALSLMPVEGATWAIGGWLGNDYRNFAGGGFTFLYLTWNILKVFGPKERPSRATPAPPAAAPASPVVPAIPPKAE
jgi:hypothetical protein